MTEYLKHYAVGNRPDENKSHHLDPFVQNDRQSNFSERKQVTDFQLR
jgi:hypothetical protein